ncbi:hypothetical protein [Micromonospora chersina]|uniref:hypothetical protein n=1 Tax=Micromonospora chersina TaxID=47854 RepID=UPI00371EB93B
MHLIEDGIRHFAQSRRRESKFSVRPFGFIACYVRAIRDAIVGPIASGDAVHIDNGSNTSVTN